MKKNSKIKEIYNYSNRIKSIRDVLFNGDNAEFSKIMGEKENTVSNWINRGAAIKVLEKILGKLPQINPTWLLTGEGEMLKSEAPQETAKPPMPTQLEINFGKIADSNMTLADTNAKLSEQIIKLSNELLKLKNARPATGKRPVVKKVGE